MKSFLLLLLVCLTAGEAAAQAPIFDDSMLDVVRHVVLPGFALFLLGSFIIAAIKLVLNYLLKQQIIAAGVSEGVAKRLLPGPQDERRKIVKWISLLLSTSAGLAACNWYLPLGLHSVIILLVSTALGFLAYYFFLSRQPQ